MQYTLTKYLTADYLRENEFLKAYLELVDEIIFCCSMESLDILSNMSFESMDDNYFVAYQNFFLSGLSTYDVNKLDKLVLSEWFSLLHVRGELSDIDKLLKFGGSLKNKEKNVFGLYHNADVPNQTINTTKDGLIYLITEDNIDIDQDFLINQQIPAGYRIGLIKTPSPFLVTCGDSICFGEKNIDLRFLINSGDAINISKTTDKDITFYRRRQFDQYYTFGQVYRSQYTVNQLSQYHQKGYYFFGFEVENAVPMPVSYDVDESAYGCIASTYGEFYINEGSIIDDHVDLDYDFLVVKNNGRVARGFPYEEVVIVEEAITLPTVYRFSDHNTSQSILPDFGFDTNLDYNENNLYVVQTGDGQGNITRIGWETVLKPPVSTSGNFGTYNWLDNGDQGTPTSVSPDQVVTLYIDNLTPAYDETKSYGVVQWQTTSGTTAGRTEFALVNSSGNMVAKNVSSSTQSFSQVKVAVCSSSDATVVTVYDSSNVAYNAFKYTLNGTDYYYVLDDTQTDWTSDLSYIGYTLSPYPIVHSYTGVQTAENIEADMSFDTGLEYSSSNLYIGETNDGQGNVTRYGWECIARVPYYAIGGVVDSTSEQDIMVHVSYETFGVLEQDS